MTVTYEAGSGLYVNVTNRCTNACEFCVRTVADGTYGELWLENEPTKEQILADILARDLSKYTEIVFCGYGEPTLRLYDVLFVAEQVKKQSAIPIRINTNGHACLIYERDVTPDFAGKIDAVSVSLNTADASDYVKVCHPDFGEAAFDSLIEFARKVKPYVKSVAFSVVEGSIPDADIEKCKEIAEKNGVPLKIREYIK